MQDLVTHSVAFSCNFALVQIHVWFVAEHDELVIAVTRQVNYTFVLVGVHLLEQRYEPRTEAMHQSMKIVANFVR